MPETRKNADAFFHRLANTETVASLDMKVSPRDPKSFKESLRSPDKNKPDSEPPKTPAQKKTTVRAWRYLQIFFTLLSRLMSGTLTLSSFVVLPKASFFERMSKSDTFASRDMKKGKREPKSFKDSIGNR